MSERQWQLYRLSVVEKWPESPYKRAVSGAIEYKLRALEAADEKTQRALDMQAFQGFPRAARLAA